MKYLTHTLTIFICSLFIISCDKKDAPDTEQPAIIATGVAANDTLRNTINAEIKATDNGGIQKMEVLVNDSLLATASSSPLVLTWNTLKMKDGEYTLKLKATDNSGNIRETTSKVIIKNALFSLAKEVLNLTSNNEMYFIATDPDGKILNSLKITKTTVPSDVTIYPREAFTGKKINILRINRGSQTVMSYFLNIERGEPTVYFTSPIPKAKRYSYSANTAASIKNLQPNDYAVISTDAFGSSYPPGFDAKYPYGADSKFLVQIERNGSATYNLFDPPAPGVTTMQFDAALITKPSKVKTVSFAYPVTQGLVDAYGTAYKDYLDQYTFENNKNFAGNSVSIFYPESLTPDLFGYLSYEHNDFRYNHFFKLSFPDKIDAVDFDASVTNKSFTGFTTTFSGDFQYYKAAFGTTYIQNGSDPSFIGIDVYGLKPTTQFKFPNIGSEVSIPGYDLSALKLRTIEMNKFATDIKLSNIISSISYYTYSGENNYTRATKYFPF
jgi:hypothetical protein